MGERPSVTRKTAVLAIILVSYLMIVLDISIVITALPRIHDQLHFSATELSWVQTAYTLTFGGLLLLGGRAGDIVGRRLTFVLGLALFTAASFAVGVAQSALWLVAARAVQGIGAAILAPSTLAILTTTFTAPRERTRAIAYYGAVAGIGASLGLVVGGVVTSWLSWRVGFFINLPIGAVLIAAALRYLPETERRAGRFDLVGAVSSTLGMSGLVYGMVRSTTAGWTDVFTVASLALGVVFLVAFVLNEWRVPQPIMPLHLLADRERAGAYSARILYLGAMLGFWFFITQFLQTALGYTPIQAGLAFLPMTLVNFGVALAVPWFTRRFGNPRLLGVGVTLTLVGMAWLSRLSADTPYLSAVALPMVLIGIGQGFSLSPLTASGIAGVRPEDAGAAGGVVNVAHQLGGSLGLGFLVTIFAAAGSATLDPRHLLAHQVSTALTAGSAMLAGALVLVVVLIILPSNHRSGGPSKLAVETGTTAGLAAAAPAGHR